MVAPLAGSVDRNCAVTARMGFPSALVAPLAGSVDRNGVRATVTTSQNVAPLAGSVDRNVTKRMGVRAGKKSLPSRGAWIEILQLWADTLADVSLPSRGAWIEILPGPPSRMMASASLPSRGAWIEIFGPGC